MEEAIEMTKRQEVGQLRELQMARGGSARLKHSLRSGGLEITE